MKYTLNILSIVALILFCGCGDGDSDSSGDSANETSDFAQLPIPEDLTWETAYGTMDVAYDQPFLDQRIHSVESKSTIETPLESIKAQFEAGLLFVDFAEAFGSLVSPFMADEVSRQGDHIIAKMRSHVEVQNPTSRTFLKTYFSVKCAGDFSISMIHSYLRYILEDCKDGDISILGHSVSASTDAEESTYKGGPAASFMKPDASPCDVIKKGSEYLIKGECVFTSIYETDAFRSVDRITANDLKLIKTEDKKWSHEGKAIYYREGVTIEITHNPNAKDHYKATRGEETLEWDQDPYLFDPPYDGSEVEQVDPPGSVFP